jgi:hypothetical protein
MRRVLLTVLLSSLLAACTTYYHHPGGNANFDKDKRECQKIAEKNYINDDARVCDEIDRCLKSRGWVTR